MQLTHIIDDAIMPNVAAARAAYNASLAPDPNAAPGSLNPGAMDTNETFLKFQLDEMVRAWVRKYGLLPPPPPPPPAPDPNAVPASCTRKQGLKALARATDPSIGMAAPIYEADILATIDAMPETTDEEKLAKYDMQIEFRDALTWRLGNPFFESMVVAMGITPEQRDALLRLAVTFLD